MRGFANLFGVEFETDTHSGPEPFAPYVPILEVPHILMRNKVGKIESYQDRQAQRFWEIDSLAYFVVISYGQVLVLRQFMSLNHYGPFITKEPRTPTGKENATIRHSHITNRNKSS